MTAQITVPIGDISHRVTKGTTPRMGGFTQSGISFVKVESITEEGDINPNKLAFIDEETNKTLARSVLQKDDLLFSIAGTIGRVARVSQSVLPANTNQALAIIRPDTTKVDVGYLLYCLRDRERMQDALSMVVQSVQANLSLSELSAIRIPYRPLNEQRAIAEVLGALDNKIAANTKLANNASSLVELEFNRLMKRTRRSVVLGDLLALEYGKALPATKRVPGTVRVYGSGGVVGTHNEALHQGPGVVVGRKGTAGAVHWSPSPFFPIDTTYWVRPLEEFVSPVFAYFLLKSLRLEEMNSDSAVPGLNRSEALAAPVLWPPSPELQSFTDEAMKLFDVSAQMDLENVMLANTRDVLLPQIMSGKMRVQDAVTQVASLV